MSEDGVYRKSILDWRAIRLSRLAAEDGWLNIVGRWELEPGSVTLGAGVDRDIVFPVGPDQVGTLIQDESGGVTFVPAADGAPLRLVLDKNNPPRFSVDRLLLEVTTLRNGNALRVRDKYAPARMVLPVINHYPIDRSWHVVADWVPLDVPITMTVDTMVGIPTEVSITHKAVFSHDGTRYKLLPTHGTAQSPQFVLRDQTSGVETYAASRFLFGEDIKEGTITLDFNKAINPPCAFTTHAVCPLPPAQNILPFRVNAGELRFD